MASPLHFPSRLLLPTPRWSAAVIIASLLLPFELLLHCGERITDKFDWLLRGLLSATWDRGPATMSIHGIRLFPLPGTCFGRPRRSGRSISLVQGLCGFWPMQDLAAFAVPAGGCSMALQLPQLPHPGIDCRTRWWEKAGAISLCALPERVGCALRRKDYRSQWAGENWKVALLCVGHFLGKSMH